MHRFHHSFNFRNTFLGLVFISFFFASCQQQEDAKKRILFVTSNQDTYGSTTLSAANHFAEIVVAYDVFIQNGFAVDVVSPQGGAIPLGYINTTDSIQKKYLYDTTLMNLLKYTMKPSEVSPEKYSAIYYSGGGAAMFGVPENEKIQKIASDIYNNNGVLSAVCHGTAGITSIKDSKGIPLYANKKINGFPDQFERKDASYYQTFPFSIEQAIIENGGNFVYSKKGWDGYHIVDGRIITGQDPSSTVYVAQEIVNTLKN